MVSGTYNFQDPAGNPLAGGSVTFTLNTDAMAGDVQVCAGRVVTFDLDDTGSFTGMLWASDELMPLGITYRVRAYTVEGQLVFEQDLLV
jgi:hypothetical protein